MADDSEYGPTTFDLDEDSVPETVMVDTNADAVADVVAFDLDEDSVAETIVVDTNADFVADTVVVDTDADAVPDTAFDLDVDVDEDSGTPVAGAAAGMAEGGEPELAADFDLDTDVVADDGIPTGEAYEGERDLSEDSLTTPPEDVTNDDLQDASEDLEHMNLMNTYMQSTGVI